jgi:hypothetical protein
VTRSKVQPALEHPLLVSPDVLYTSHISKLGLPKQERDLIASKERRLLASLPARIVPESIAWTWDMLKIAEEFSSRCELITEECLDVMRTRSQDVYIWRWGMMGWDARAEVRLQALPLHGI